MEIKIYKAKTAVSTAARESVENPSSDWDDMLAMLQQHMLDGSVGSEDALDYIEDLHKLLKISHISPKDAPEGTLDAWWTKE